VTDCILECILNDFKVTGYVLQFNFKKIKSDWFIFKWFKSDWLYNVH